MPLEQAIPATRLVHLKEILNNRTMVWKDVPSSNHYSPNGQTPDQR